MPSDTRAALEWQAVENLKCPGCGHLRSRTMADDDHAPDYEAESLKCRACEARDIEARDQVDRNAGRPLNGVYQIVREVTSNGNS